MAPPGPGTGFDWLLAFDCLFDLSVRTRVGIRI